MSMLIFGAHLTALALLLLGYPVPVDVSVPAQSAPGALPEVSHDIPKFPVSEIYLRREGWVIVEYTIKADGSVVGACVKHSSGSRAFEESALKAVRKWQFEPGSVHTRSAQIQFIFKRREQYVSRPIYEKLKLVHEMIDLGKIEAASFGIWWIRSRDTVNAFENAYLLVAEGRIAEHEGNPAGQLEYFRRAALSQGRWLAASDYARILRGMAILELQLGDFASAIMHFDELASIDGGEALAADLAGVFQEVSLTEPGGAEGFSAADELVSVVQKYRPRRRLPPPEHDDSSRWRPMGTPLP